MFFACLITRVWDKLSTTVYPIYKWNQLASDMIVHTQTSIGSLGSVGDNSITASSRKKFPDQLESKNPLEKAPVESMENGKVLDNPWKSWISMEKKHFWATTVTVDASLVRSHSVLHQQLLRRAMSRGTRVMALPGLGVPRRERIGSWRLVHSRVN